MMSTIVERAGVGGGGVAEGHKVNGSLVRSHGKPVADPRSQPLAGECSNHLLGHKIQELEAGSWKYGRRQCPENPL